MPTEIPRIKLSDLQHDYPGVFESAQYVDVGIGWLPIIEEFLMTALPLDPQLAIHELKEKFGGLRIWCDSDVEGVRLAKAKAHLKSIHVCEVCGQPGSVRIPPAGNWAWWRCVCDEHVSDDQRSWPQPPARRLDDMTQVRGAWYRYDRERDELLPCAPPQRKDTSDA